MLLFTAHSPVGHAIHVCSMVTFVIGDEDVVLPNIEPVYISAAALRERERERERESVCLEGHALSSKF
jgi:hypothetical protein